MTWPTLIRQCASGSAAAMVLLFILHMVNVVLAGFAAVSTGEIQ